MRIGATDSQAGQVSVHLETHAPQVPLDGVDRSRSVVDLDEFDGDRGSVADEGIETSVSDEASGIEGDDVVTDALDLLEAVARKQHVDAEFFADLANQRQHLVALDGIEPVGRLIEQHEGRVGCNGLGQLDPLALPGRHGAEWPEPFLAEADQPQRVACSALRLLSWHASNLGEMFHEIGCSHVLREHISLGDVSDLRPQFAGMVTRIEAQHRHGSRRRNPQAERNRHERGFPCAVRADQPGHPEGDVDAHRVECKLRSESHRQPAGGEHRHAAHPRHAGGRLLVGSNRSLISQCTDVGENPNTALMPLTLGLARYPPIGDPMTDVPTRSATTAAHAAGATKIYGSGDTEVRALDGVDVTFEKGAFTAIMGPSGSGKSTLMHCMAGLDTLTDGEVFIGETALSTLSEKDLTLLRRDNVGFVFQAFNLVPTLSAIENITLPMDLAGTTPDHAWLKRVIDTVGLADRTSHRPNELSGGQQQRVAVSRALATRPEIIFADEPTGNVDSTTGSEILSFMRSAVDEFGQTIVMVTHDPVAASFANRVIFLVDGKIVDELLDPTPETVLDMMKSLGD